MARFLRTNPDFCEQALRTYFFSTQVSKDCTTGCFISTLEEAQSWIFYLEFSVWKHIHEWYRIALDDLCFPVNSPTTSVISLAEANCLVSHLVLQNYSGLSILGSERQKGAQTTASPRFTAELRDQDLTLYRESKHCSSHHLTTVHHGSQVKMTFYC